MPEVTHVLGFAFFFFDVDGPARVVDGVCITIWPVIDDNELFVCLPGSFVDVGGILVMT